MLLRTARGVVLGVRGVLGLERGPEGLAAEVAPRLATCGRLLDDLLSVELLDSLLLDPGQNKYFMLPKPYIR